MEENLNNPTQENQVDIENLVKGMLEKGIDGDEIIKTLQEMLNENKISEEDYKMGVELVNKADKELASKEFGVNIL